jgi:hypothetical protein
VLTAVITIRSVNLEGCEMDTKLCSIREQPIAGMIENVLRGYGFHPRPLPITGNIAFAGTNLWYDIWVPEEEAENAREIVVQLGYSEALAGKKE